MRHLALSCVSLFLLTGPAAAAGWLEASSDHFVIYSDQSEKEVAGFADRLERYHAAMAYVFKKQQARPSPSNRVAIFVVSDRTQVRRIAGTANPYLAGFYVPRAGSSVAVVPERTARYGVTGDGVLLHEYAHHFMYTLTARSYPRWFTEGFAELFGGVRFGSDGSVRLGAPTNHRYAELNYAEAVPIRRMLDFDGGASDSKGYDAFYAQSWLLFHYLLLEPARAGQLSKFQQRLAAGDTALEAAEHAFGNLDRLASELEAYQRRRRINVMVVDVKALGTGAVAIRKLRPGEAAMIPTVIESRVGVSAEEAVALLPQARKVAAEYPDDPAVLAALAEAEYDAGNDDAAIAAADRALALDPNRINAHLQKGYALFRKASSAAVPPTTWKDVRMQFVQANKVEHDHPVPLVRNYMTYLEQRERPTDNAIAGLEWAMQLAPFDPSLRWLVAQQMINDQRLREAVQTLGPLAYSPHRGEHTEQARLLLQGLEARLAGGQVSSAGPAKAD